MFCEQFIGKQMPQLKTNFQCTLDGGWRPRISKATQWTGKIEKGTGEGKGIDIILIIKNNISCIIIAFSSCQRRVDLFTGLLVLYLLSYNIQFLHFLHRKRKRAWYLHVCWSQRREVKVPSCLPYHLLNGRRENTNCTTLSTPKNKTYLTNYKMK